MQVEHDRANHTTGILAAYIKPLDEAASRGDPIRATLQTANLEATEIHEGIVLPADGADGASLTALIKGLFSLKLKDNGSPVAELLGSPRAGTIPCLSISTRQESKG